MKTRSSAEIAEYFGVAPALFEMIPTLLADFYELGSYPDRIADLLGAAALAPRSRVLDIGCGKGCAGYPRHPPASRRCRVVMV